VGEVWSEQVQRVFFDKEAERAELLKRPSEILWSCSVLLGHSVSTSFLLSGILKLVAQSARGGRRRIAN